MATVTLKAGPPRDIPLGWPNTRIYTFTAGQPVDVPDAEAPRFQASKAFTVEVAGAEPAAKPAKTRAAVVPPEE